MIFKTRVMCVSTQLTRRALWLIRAAFQLQRPAIVFFDNTEICQVVSYVFHPLLFTIYLFLPAFFQGKELPKRLWQMLLVNSPNMTELTLEGTCQTTQLWNIRKVLSGRWAQLRYFSIGSLSSRELPEDDQAMVDFISAHPTLENIHFQSGLYYSRTSMFYLPSLPLLRSFTGRIQQLKLAPELPSLQYLYFLDWFSPSARFAEILQSVPTVTSLSISMNPLELIERKTCLGLYERVITACPHLTHLEVSATGPIILVSNYSYSILCVHFSRRKTFPLPFALAPSSNRS